jgi:serine/threonine protein phosphatase PrpC
MKVIVDQVSLIGDRNENQDCALHWAQDDATVAVVADGLGGHSGGALAANFFCEGLRSTGADFVTELLASSDSGLKEQGCAWLMAAAMSMRAAVRSLSDILSPLTTCAIAVVDRSAVITLHIGDSRIYRLDAAMVQWRTRDHSVVQMLLDDGEITEAQMGTHPDQGRLLRAVGLEGDLRPSIRRHAVLSQDEALLVCSDGFWEHVRQDELCSLVYGTHSRLIWLAEQAVARAAGKSDNVTAQLLKVEQG